MDMEKIREHIEAAEVAIAAFAKIAADQQAATWRDIQVDLARAAALAEMAKVRSDEQTFVRRLVLAHVERLSVAAVAAWNGEDE